MTRIKICGLKRQEDILYVNEAMPDYAGFIIHVPKSPRNVEAEALHQLAGRLKAGIIPVGVFVDADETFVASLLGTGVIRTAQLHGHEDDHYIARLKALAPEWAKIIKAFKVKGPEDVAAAQKCPADMILLDGGSGDGKVFDWSLLKNICRPYILAGGLNEKNMDKAINVLHPWGVDLSSGVETDGRKDREKICRIVKLVRQRKEDM